MMGLPRLGKSVACVNVYDCNTRNVGDLSCAPHLYQDLGSHYVINPGSIKVNDILSGIFSRSVVILGGGGLLHPYWRTQLRNLFVEGRPKGLVKTLVVWGLGLNTHGVIDDYYPSWIKNADLVGVRDWNQGFRWVPCVSCMAPEFDRKRDVKYEMVIYDHHDFRVPLHLPHVPRISNVDHAHIAGVLDFLGSAEVVLTSTYHGAYWSSLLGKRVVAFPFSSRFHYMKHPPALATAETWKDRLPESKVYPEALVECREANTRFFQRYRAACG